MPFSRAVVTIDRRMQALDDMSAAAGQPTVEGALHAFLDTDLDLYIQGGEGWKNYEILVRRRRTAPKARNSRQIFRSRGPAADRHIEKGAA